MKSTLMIAATGSGRGKTTFVTGLLKVLKEKYNNDLSVHAFKCGPDYIDPMFHKDVLSIPSTNLDLFFCNDELLKKIYLDNSGDINIIEAAMGLYDGIGVTSKTSAMEIASLLNCKIILLVDGSGMGYSIVPLIKGFISEDRDKLIAGIVINRMSEKFYKRIAPVIEDEIGVKVLGFIPRVKGAELGSRHLGLLSPSEAGFIEKLELITNQIKSSVDIDSIIELGEESVCNTLTRQKIKCEGIEKSILKKPLDGKRILVAKDEAFSFCYEENIKLIERLGAKIDYFSPIHDRSIKNDADAIIFYGGYPENYAKELSDNKIMIESIQKAVSNNVKIIAECGGFMYLLDRIETNDNSYNMLGLIKGYSCKGSGLIRFGYVNIYEKAFIEKSNEIDLAMKAHEFHHYEAIDVEYSDDYIVKNESSGSEYKGIYKSDNIFAGFPHMYYLSNPEFIVKILK